MQCDNATFVVQNLGTVLAISVISIVVLHA